MRIDRSFKPEIVASDDVTREIICEPYLDGHEVVATDGRILAVFPIEREVTDTDGHIPKKAFPLTRANGGDGRTVAMPLRKTAICFKRSGEVVVLGRTKKNGTYPDYRNVMEPAKAVAEVAINPRLLLRLAESLGVSNGSGVTLSLALKDDGSLDYHTPIEVRATDPVQGAKAAYGWVMPMRKYNDTKRYHERNEVVTK
jgi:hypothetical protein